MARRRTPQTVLLDSTETIESYPRVFAQATGTPKARVQTVSTSMPSTFSATGVTLDSRSAEVSADAAEGAREIEIALVDGETVTKGRRYLIETYSGEVIDVLCAKDAEGELVEEGSEATGQILINNYTAFNDGDTVTLEDASGTSVTFEFRNSGSVTAGNVQVAYATSNTITASNFASAINSASIDITAASLVNAISLAQDDVGDSGNTTITLSGLTSGVELTLTQFTGGVDNEYADVTLHIEDPLPMDVDEGSTLLGWRLARALTAGETSEYGPGVVEFEATLNGVTERWTEPFYIGPRNDAYTLTGEVLKTSSPYCAQARPENDKDFSETIDAAWRLEMAPALRIKSLRGEQIVSQDILEPAHIAACELYLSRAYDRENPERIERAEKTFNEKFRQVLDTADLWIAPDDTDALPVPDPNEPPPFAVTLRKL